MDPPEQTVFDNVWALLRRPLKVLKRTWDRLGVWVRRNALNLPLEACQWGRVEQQKKMRTGDRIIDLEYPGNLSLDCRWLTCTLLTDLSPCPYIKMRNWVEGTGEVTVNE